MNLRMGSQIFNNVRIPVLWGKRAIIQHADGRLSVIDLSGPKARVEILADKPAAGIAFRPRSDGVVILDNNVELYSYNPTERRLDGINLQLLSCQIGAHATLIGTNTFSGNSFHGSAVGIAVLENGAIAVGVSTLPSGLADLVI